MRGKAPFMPAAGFNWAQIYTNEPKINLITYVSWGFRLFFLFNAEPFFQLADGFQITLLSPFFQVAYWFG